MTGTTCVVVGAGSGLGLSVAKRFGGSGYRIALVARRRDALEPLVTELAEQGIEARVFPADVEDRAALAAALADVRRDFGRVEVLYYGPEPHVPPQDLNRWLPMTMTVDEAEWRMRLTCYGLVTAVQAVLPDMIAGGKGTILSPMGGSGTDPIATLTPCSMSYGAARNYLICLNEQVADRGVYAAPIFLALLIEPGSEYGDPDMLAGMLWDMHVERDQRELNVANPAGMHAINADDMEKYGIDMPAI